MGIQILTSGFENFTNVVRRNAEMTGLDKFYRAVFVRENCIHAMCTSPAAKLFEKNPIRFNKQTIPSILGLKYECIIRGDASSSSSFNEEAPIATGQLLDEDLFDDPFILTYIGAEGHGWREGGMG
jgi:hypothetical protein